MKLREGSARIVKLPDSQILKTALPLTLVAAIAVLARTWQLSQNDFGRQYYAAGVRSMLDSWHNFLFNAFDPAGFISIDKPPVATGCRLPAPSCSVFPRLLSCSPR
jgi:4-amino-4-deoxy-L-arabinose transferase-like glycosyltransferase